MVSFKKKTGLPAIFLLLLMRLTSPPVTCQKLIYHGDRRRIPPTESIARRLASRRYRHWKKIMGNDYPDLVRRLPRLMILGITKRTCIVPLLKNMEVFDMVDFSAINMRNLRQMFSICYHRNMEFVLEFTSVDHRILVIIFTPKNGEMFMKTQLYHRFGGLIRETGEHRVTLDKVDHEISLNVEISPVKIGYAQIFYKWDINLSFPYEMGSFYINSYSRVILWSERSFDHPLWSKRSFDHPAKKTKYCC